ncbi:hypothetical protein ETI09_09390 [Macrococcoides canis]|nr:hypothetical protein ETI03_08165 [Macrococcus canis]TDM40807.1 hypothetical protein ETI09_09390 [Macrococcus canis]
MPSFHLLYDSYYERVYSVVNKYIESLRNLLHNEYIHRIKKEYIMTKDSLEEIKVKLNDFMETIDSVDPEKTDIHDIDEWLALLDQLEQKVKSIKH